MSSLPAPAIEALEIAAQWVEHQRALEVFEELGWRWSQNEAGSVFIAERSYRGDAKTTLYAGSVADLLKNVAARSRRREYPRPTREGEI